MATYIGQAQGAPEEWYAGYAPSKTTFARRVEATFPDYPVILPTVRRVDEHILVVGMVDFGTIRPNSTEPVALERSLRADLTLLMPPGHRRKPSKRTTTADWIRKWTENPPEEPPVESAVQEGTHPLLTT